MKLYIFLFIIVAIFIVSLICLIFFLKKLKCSLSSQEHDCSSTHHYSDSHHHRSSHSNDHSSSSDSGGGDSGDGGD